MTTTLRAVAPETEEDRYRSVFAALPTGVSVLTTTTPDGPAGMTASAVCSLSLRPRLALACVSGTSSTMRAILGAGTFAINVLDEGSAELSDGFATHPSQADRFDRVPYQLVEGLPVLADALAWAVCTVRETFPGGDHVVIVGEVTHLGRSAGRPLVHHDRRYTRLVRRAA